MAVWVLLSIFGTLALLMGLLVLSAWVEERFPPPEALAAAALRSKSPTPEQAEALAAQQLEQVLPRRTRAPSRLEVVEAGSRNRAGGGRAPPRGGGGAAPVGG